MAKKLEVIIREGIDIPAIAKAIRAQGYKTQVERNLKTEAIPGFGEGFALQQMQNPERFQKLKDGWVKDNFLGLEWGPSSDRRMSWEEAKKECEKLGGRLPTTHELFSLVDVAKYNPAIDKKAFPDTKTDDWYWTGDSCPWDSGSARIVNFNSGIVNAYSKGSFSYVRPVRSSQ